LNYKRLANPMAKKREKNIRKKNTRDFETKRETHKLVVLMDPFGWIENMICSLCSLPATSGK